MEDGIKYIISMIMKEDGRLNKLMVPEFVNCSDDDMTVTIEFPVLEWQLNTNNVMHGGAITTAFDMALGILANYMSDGKAVTSNLMINFLKPVPQGDSLLITAKLTSRGKKLITLYGEGRLKSNGYLADTAMATFTVIG